MQEKQFIHQPLSMIFTILQITQGMLEASKEHLGYMKEAKTKPHVLDDAIVNRSIKLFKEQNEDSILFLKQCSIWKQEDLNELQLMQVEEIEACTHSLTEINNQLLPILYYCKDRTINKILEKDDMELALDFLSGKINVP